MENQIKLLTVSQVAELTGISKRTLQEMCKGGKIAGVTVFGNNYAIPASAIDGLKPRPVGHPIIHGKRARKKNYDT